MGRRRGDEPAAREDVTYSNCSYVCSLFRSEIMRDLELPRHGLR